MIKNISLFIFVIFIAIFFSGCNTSQNNNSISSNNTVKNDEITAPAEKIEVVHFHGTHQCFSCITVGEFALKTIKNKFPKEYENGKIVFQEINGDLPENSEIVKKYQAGGSSLFVNAIVDGKDNIKEDTNVWRYTSNEKQFIEYFQSKLNTLLGQ